MCDEIINATGGAPKNLNQQMTVSTNVTSTVPINSYDKQVRYKINCYILYTFFLVIILLFIIAIIS